MQKDLKKYHGHNSSAFWLCIDDVGDCAGTLLTPCIDIPVPFCGLGDFLLKANGILDAIDFPQRFMARRSLFGRKTETPPWIAEHLQEPASDFEMEKKLSFRGSKTAMRFFIRVMCRQNASWQGELTFVNKKSKICFRSALELMEAISEAAETIYGWTPAPHCTAARAMALEG